MSSKVIDQRVVQMEFDNRRFEKNVSTTMSSLEKLKQKLNFTGAVKGFDNISSASKKINMNGLANAVDTVNTRFSALEIMGVTALANITNSAVNAGKRILSALTIQPVTTGFSEYELKMNSVQTIMASTGKSIEEVNKYLDELNTYSDQTIYSFSDMTQNIGKFTNAGVKLEDAVAAIKGISNEAAVSGANANEASRAMYNFAQALSAGYVKLIDWKSIENANMATVEFKEQLIDTAVKLGTVTKASDGMYETLEGNAFSATKNFNEVLQDQWMTSEVLISTLKDYADETTDIGKKASEAATKVKTFTQLFDTLKESAQSGWARTWEIVVGDLVEATDFLTKISDSVGGMIESMSAWRNGILESALGSKWGELTEKIDKAGISTEDFNKKFKKVAEKHGLSIDGLIDDHMSLEEVMSKTGASTDLIKETLAAFGEEAQAASDSTKDMSGKLEYFQEVVRKVWRGDYGNMEDRFKALTEAGYDYAQVQDLVNKTVDGHELTLADLTDSQLKSVGYTEEQVEAIKKLGQEANKAGTPLSELIDSLDKPSGRTLLLEALGNAAKGLTRSFKALKDAFFEIFPETKVENMGNSLYNLIAALNHFSKSLAMGDETAENLQRTFKGVFALIDIILTLVAGPVRMIFKAVLDVLGLVDVDILSVTANIGDAIVALRDWIDEHNIFTIALKKILPFLKDAAKGVKDWIEGLKDSKYIGRDIVAGLVNGLWSGIKTVGTTILELAKKIYNVFTDFFGIHSPSTLFYALGGFIIAGLVLGITQSGPDAWSAIKNVASAMYEHFKEGAMGVWTLATTVVSKLTEIFSELSLDKLIAVGLGTASFIGLFKLLDVLGNFAKAAAGIVENVGDVLDGIGKMFTGIGKMFTGVGRMFTSIAILNIVIAVTLLAKAVVALATVDADGKRLWNAVGIIAVLGVIVVGLTTLMSLVSKLGGVNVKSTVAVAAIAVGLFLVVLAISKITTIDLTKVSASLTVLGTIVGSLIALVIAMSLLAKGSGAIVKAGGTILAMSVAMLIMLAVVKIASKMEESDLKKGLNLVGGFTIICAGLILASKFAGKATKDAGKMLRKVAVSMLLMLAVVKLASMIPLGDVKRGMSVVMLISGLFMAILYVSRLANSNSLDAGKALFRVSVSMLAMIAVMKLAAGMERGEIQRGLTVVIALGALFAALIAVSKLAGSNASKAGIMLIAMSGAMLVMTGVLFLLSQMDPSGLGKGLAIVAALGLIFAGLIAVTKLAKGDEIFKTLLMLSITVALLGGLVIGLSFLDPAKLAGATACIAALVVAFAALVGVTKFAGDSKNLIKTLGILMGVAVLLAGIVVGLSFLPNSEGLLEKVEAMTLLMTALAATVYVLSRKGFNKLKKGMFMSLLQLTVIIAALGAVIVGMSQLGGTTNAITNAIALSILLPILVACVGVLGTLPRNSKGMAGAVLVLGEMTGVVALIGLILAMMSALNVQNSISNVVALSIMLTAMTLLLKPLIVIGGLWKQALGGVLALAAMAAPLALIGLVLAMMTALNVKDAIPNVIALSTLMTVMTLLLIPLSLIGPMAAAALPAIGILLLFVTALGAFMVGVGALVTYFPKIEEFLDKGIDILSKLAYGLGSIIGSFIGGLSAGALSDFMDSLSGFIDGVGGIGEEVLDGAKYVAGAVAVISGAAFLNNLTSFLPFGESLPLLGSQLTRFMTNAKGFMSEATKLKPEAVAGVKTLADAILIMTAANLVDSLAGASTIFGEGALEKFGSQLPEFGKNLGMFAQSLTDAGLDDSKITTVQNAATALKILAEASNSIPNSGGLLGAIVGNNDLGVFSEQFPKLGVGLRNFLNAVGSFGEDQLVIIRSGAEAVTSLANAAANIPNQGGWVGAIVGENTMDMFAAQFPLLGAGLRGFLNAIGTFEAEQIETVKTAAEAVTTLATAAANIPNQGGWVGAIVGDNDLGTFATQFPLLGAGLRGFLNAAGTFDDNSITTVSCAADAVVSLATAASRIPNQGGWAAAIVGDNDLGTFASQFPLLGAGIRGFVDKIGELTSGELLASSRALAVVETMTGLAKVDVGGLNSKVKSLGETMTTFGDNIVSFSNTMDSGNVTIHLKNAIDGVRDLVDALAIIPADKANHLKTISTSLKELGQTGVKSFIDAYSGPQALNSIKLASTLMVQRFVTGVKTEGTKIADNFESAVSSAYARVTKRELYEKFVSAGGNLAQGFANGIRNNTYKVTNAAEVMASAAIRAAKAKLDEHSPSRVFYGIGDFAVRGFANALHAGATDVYNEGSRMADAATEGLSNAISRISSLMESGIDSQPVIRPVLDLDNIRAGASQIGGMLSMSPSVGVLANVNGVASTMNARGQNGANSGVISELGKLRKDISALKHITYQIDGVSYGEGSDVAEAIETLVRAALMERRV